MRYGKIVPSLHSTVSNPAIDFENTLSSSIRSCANGNALSGKANCSAPSRSQQLGAGGSNAHVILEEYLPEEVDVLIRSEAKRTL
jgi:polyketide synthase PksN